MAGHIDADDFQAWLAHPITLALFAKCDLIGEACRTSWGALSWGIPINDLQERLPMEKLAFLRGKAEAFNSVRQLKYVDLYKDEKAE